MWDCKKSIWWKGGNEGKKREKKRRKRQLINIIEKPPIEEIDNFRDKLDKIRVSMNIFKFFGPTIYPYIKNCPLHPERKEKEIPEAVRNYIKEFPNSFDAIPFFEHIPDLTSAKDILSIIKSIPNSNE